MNFAKKITGLSVAVLLAVGLAACGNDAKTENDTDKTESVGKSVNYKITGIDPGAGIMQQTEKAIEEYELSDWDLVSGSSAAMTASLKKPMTKKSRLSSLVGRHTGNFLSMI